MDLNLAELSGVPETANLCATVMNVLKQLVPENGGPYLLVFWTQVGGEIDEVQDAVRTAGRAVPFPIAVVELAKGPFIVADPGNRILRSLFGSSTRNCTTTFRSWKRP